MTLEEAKVAAIKKLPVISRDIEYKRIKQIGCDFDEHGRGVYFLLLEDYNGCSFSRANPMFVSLKERNAASGRIL